MIKCSYGRIDCFSPFSGCHVHFHPIWDGCGKRKRRVSLSKDLTHADFWYRSHSSTSSRLSWCTNQIICFSFIFIHRWCSSGLFLPRSPSTSCPSGIYIAWNEREIERGICTSSSSASLFLLWPHSSINRFIDVSIYTPEIHDSFRRVQKVYNRKTWHPHPDLTLAGFEINLFCKQRFIAPTVH